MDDKEQKRRQIAWWRHFTRPRPPQEDEDEDEDRRSLEEWQNLVEQRIQEAMERGDFDNLPGKGKPLRREPNPFVDPADDLAYSLLRGQGFTLQWIEERKLIQADIEAARTRLHRAWHWYMRRVEVLNSRDPDDPEVIEERRWVERRWQEYVDEFRATVEEINRRIDTYNLMVPLVRFQLFRVRLKEELRALGMDSED